MRSRCLSVTIGAVAFTSALSYCARARAQEAPQEEHIVEQRVDDPRYSIRAVGALGLGTGTLGTPLVGGALELDRWGRDVPLAFGLRVGGLATGGGSEEKHGTYYAGVAVSSYALVGSGRLLVSFTIGGALIRGPYAGTDAHNQPTDSGSGPILTVRGGYLAPVGPLRLGIALDGILIPGAGTALVAAPMLDVPF